MGVVGCGVGVVGCRSGCGSGCGRMWSGCGRKSLIKEWSHAYYVFYTRSTYILTYICECV